MTLPRESQDGVTYISQTLHKPLQLYFLKYAASQEHLCSGTQKQNSGKQAGGGTQKFLDRDIAWEMLEKAQYKRR